MRYNLGLMDKYPIEAAGSNIENNPMFRATFKQPIDPIKLEDATYKALDVYPLFKTKVMYDKGYYLETNDKPIIIIHANEENRPINFGKYTNDYPWQICYDKNKLTFEWLHGVSDGAGAFCFIKQVICNYFDVSIKGPSQKFLLATGLEPFFDKKEKGINFKNDPSGFSIKYLPVLKRGYKTDFYQLQANTKNVLEVSKYLETSIAPILAILFSKAIRKHLNEDVKNKNVACNVVLDLRRPLNYETMHNCVEYKRITYLDEYENYSFKTVAKIYKEKLDNARIPQNVVRIITDRVKMLGIFDKIKNKSLLKFFVKYSGNLIKNLDCNFVVTYLGKVEFPKKVSNKLDNFDFKVWHDFGQGIISCVDYNGKLNINICENYVEKGIVDDFIKYAHDIGIEMKLIDKGIYEQAHFEE